MASYERLSVSDRIFLEMETNETNLHVAGCFLFDAGPLRTPQGGLDFDLISDYVESRLYRIPRYRQRVQYVPIEGDPIWVDDPTFNLQYHVRHTHLPQPGDERQLKRLCGRIVSQLLDRGKPLWEMWVVDGLDGDRFAVITKVHHCMTDGVGGVELLGNLLDASPRKAFKPGPTWLPRAVPDRRELIREAITRRLRAPASILRSALRSSRDPRAALEQAIKSVRGLREAAAYTTHPASPTPINQAIGSHRRFEWTSIDLAAIKEIKNRVGATVNDVALATAAGAFSRFLERRGISMREQENLDFRAACPVNVRSESERGQLGNRISNLIVQLPLAEHEPLQRLASIHETMDELKSSDQLLALDALQSLGEITHPSLLLFFVRANVEKGSSNFVFTNVPGPTEPWYLLDAPLLETYPVAPLLPMHGVGIAVMSYCGSLYWGFNSDWEQVPDLHELVLATEESFRELHEAALKSEAAPRAKARRKPRANQRVASQSMRSATKDDSP
jgi:WS/DGAT/MGAT family acyltransferase